MEQLSVTTEMCCVIRTKAACLIPGVAAFKFAARYSSASGKGDESTPSGECAFSRLLPRPEL